MNKTNREEIEEVSNNMLTGEKFDEMTEKYKGNPIIRFFMDKNRCPGYCEISLISMWIKTLQDVPELVKVGKEITNHEKDYQHARLQLKVAATIHRNDDSNVIKMEPVIEPNDLKDPKKSRKPDILADIRGKRVYIEIVTKNEAERYEKYYNIGILVKEMAKRINPNKTVYVDTHELQTIPSIQEIDGVLRDVASRFQKGTFSFCIPKEHLFSWDNISENDSERFLSYLSNYRNIRWAESAKIRKSDDGKTIHIIKEENSAKVTIDEKEEKAPLKISDDKTPHNLKIKKEGGELNIYHKNNFVITVREGCKSSSCSIEGATQRVADVIRHIIQNKSAQLPKNSPGFIVTDLTGIRSNGPDGEYIKKEIQRCFESHEHCSDLLGMAFISNHAYFNTGGCFEEPYCMFFENDNHNCGIDSKDVVNALKGRWHADFTCLKRYRDLFDDFYNRVHVLKYEISRGQS